LLHLFSRKKPKQALDWDFIEWIVLFDFGLATLSHILQSSFPRQPILDIEESSDSTLLVGVDGQGIWEISKITLMYSMFIKRMLDDPFSLSGNGVYDIFNDEW
jgi:hypothetical protein